MVANLHRYQGFGHKCFLFCKMIVVISRRAPQPEYIEVTRTSPVFLHSGTKCWHPITTKDARTHTEKHTTLTIFLSCYDYFTDGYLQTKQKKETLRSLDLCRWSVNCTWGVRENGRYASMVSQKNEGRFHSVFMKYRSPDVWCHEKKIRSKEKQGLYVRNTFWEYKECLLIRKWTCFNYE